MNNSLVALKKFMSTEHLSFLGRMFQRSADPLPTFKWRYDSEVCINLYDPIKSAEASVAENTYSSDERRLLFNNLVDCLDATQEMVCPYAEFSLASIFGLYATQDPTLYRTILFGSTIYPRLITSDFISSGSTRLETNRVKILDQGHVGELYGIQLMTDSYRHPDTRSIGKQNWWTFPDPSIVGSYHISESDLRLEGDKLVWHRVTTIELKDISNVSLITVA